MSARAPQSRRASAASLCSRNIVAVWEFARSGRFTVRTATPSSRSSTSRVSSSTSVVDGGCVVTVGVVVISAP